MTSKRKHGILVNYSETDVEVPHTHDHLVGIYGGVNREDL